MGGAGRNNLHKSDCKQWSANKQHSTSMSEFVDASQMSTVAPERGPCKFSEFRAKPCRVRTTLADFGPKSDRKQRPMSVEVGPSSTNFGPESTKSRGRKWTEFDLLRPKLARDVRTCPRIQGKLC